MYKVILTVVFLVMSLSAFAQQPVIDSLEAKLTQLNPSEHLYKEVLNDLAWLYWDVDPSKAKQYTDKLITFAKRDQDPWISIYASRNMAVYYEINRTMDSALWYYKHVVKLAKQLNSEMDAAVTYNNIGIVFFVFDQYDSALTYHYKALRIFEKLNKPKNRIEAQVNIANVFLMQEDYAKAIEKYEDSYELAKRINDNYLIMATLQLLASGYKHMDVIDSVEKYALMGLPIAKKENNNYYLRAFYFNLGNVALDRNDLAKGKSYFQQSLDIANKMGMSNRQAEATRNLGIIAVKEHRYDDAKQLLQSALDTAKAIEDLYLIKNCYDVFYDLYQAQGDIKTALDYHLLFDQMNDSLLNIEKANRIASLEITYETEKKNMQIELQQARITGLENQSRADRLRKYLLGGGLFAVAIIGLIGISLFRQRARHQARMRQKEKEFYEKELVDKQKELTNYTLHLVQKRELLDGLRTHLDQLKQESDDHRQSINRMIQKIKYDDHVANDWENFKKYFDQVHTDFDKRLREKSLDLTSYEMRLAALLKMTLTTREIAAILNISPDSVNKSRYRLRKKLGLTTDQSLERFFERL